MIFEALMDFVFPRACVNCGQEGKFLCKECGDRLDLVDQICPECGEESVMGWTHPGCKTRWGMDGLIAIYEYQEPVMRSVIDGIKYGFNRRLVGELLEGFQFETGEEFNFLVPVPLYFYRENWRGFNQAEEMGKVIGSAMGISMERVLKRVRNTRQQVRMKSRGEREKNVQGAFVLERKWLKKLKGKKVLLVDDVFTSGANMREGAKILKKAGVKKVWGLSLAH